MTTMIHETWRVVCQGGEVREYAARAEADALRAIVEGRTVAPTDAEIAAHAAAGGDWLVVHRGGGGTDTLQTWRIAQMVRDETVPARWWPLDATGRPCAWPEVQL